MTTTRFLALTSLLLVLAGAATAQTGQPFVPAQTWYTDAFGQGTSPDGNGSVQIETNGTPGLQADDHTHPVPAGAMQGIEGSIEFRLSPTRRHLYCFGTAVGGVGARMYLYEVPAADGAVFDPIAGGIAFADGIAFERFFDHDAPGLPSYFCAVSIAQTDPTQRIYWVNLTTGVSGFTNDLPPSVEADLTFAPSGIAAFLRHDGTFDGQSTYRLVELCDDDLGSLVNQGGSPYDDLPSGDIAAAYLVGDAGSGFSAEVWHAGSFIGASTLDDCSGPAPTVGACCADGQCADGLTEADCLAAGGEWQGAGTTCAGTTCPEIPMAAPTLVGSAPVTTSPLTPTVFSFTCRNVGTAAAEVAGLSVTLPSNDVEFVAAGQGGVHLPAQQRVVWQLGTIGAGDEVTVTLTLAADCAASSISLGTYYAYANNAPAVFGPAVSSTVVPPDTSPLTAATSASVPLGEPVGTGETIVYTVDLANPGGTDRPGLGAAINYGQHVALDAVLDDADGTVTDEGFRLLWEGDLPAGASRQLVFRLRVIPCRQGEDLQTQLNNGAGIGLTNLCGQFIQSIPVPPAVAVAPADAATSFTLTSLPAPTVMGATFFRVPALVRPGASVDLLWQVVNRGTAPLVLAGTHCDLGGLAPATDPPFLGPPPPGVAWDAGQNRITFAGELAPDDTLQVAFAVVYPTGADCQLSLVASVGTSDCATLAQGVQPLVAVPDPLSAPHLLANNVWGQIARAEPDSGTTVESWLCFTGEVFWDVSANADGSFWLAGLPTYRIDPATLELTALGGGFAADLGLDNIRHVVEDSTTGVVYVAGNHFIGGQSYLRLRAWDPATDQRTPVYDEQPDQTPRLGDPQAMVLDDAGHLAIGTLFGLFRIDPDDPTGAVLYTDPLLPSGVINLALLPDGRYAVADNVWGTGTQPLVAIDPADGAHGVLVADLNDWEQPSATPYSAAAADDADHLFLATQEGMITQVDLATTPPTLSTLPGVLPQIAGLAWRPDAGGSGPTPVVDRPSTPAALVFHGAAPNPFNPRTTLSFELPQAEKVRLELFDLRGRLVATLVDAELAAGPHQVVWRGTDRQGRTVASGLYLARLAAGGSARTSKLLLAR